MTGSGNIVLEHAGRSIYAAQLAASATAVTGSAGQRTVAMAATGGTAGESRQVEQARYGGGRHAGSIRARAVQSGQAMRGSGRRHSGSSSRQRASIRVAGAPARHGGAAGACASTGTGSSVGTSQVVAGGVVAGR